jgi:hypothetical protein
MDEYIARAATKAGQARINLTTFSHYYAHIWSFDNRYRPHNQVACNFSDGVCIQKERTEINPE